MVGNSGGGGGGVILALIFICICKRKMNYFHEFSWLYRVAPRWIELFDS